MKTVCQTDQCAGCMACVDICPKKAIKIEDSLKAYNAVISDTCINCGACNKVCQKNNPATMITPQAWYQGWAKKDIVRQGGSSGGLAMALAETFVKYGGEVCSCVFDNGKFGFSVAGTIGKLNQFAGSKYVKSNPLGIYKIIKEKLRAGIAILFIGLPCQVSALRNFVGEKLSQNLTTVDLICHGTPSPQILENFLQQYGVKLNNCGDIRFRTKGKFRLEKTCEEDSWENYEEFTPKGVSDRYLISFLNALTYTENCYNCQYAILERVSDITLGDSWGSKLDADEWEKGISLILCQTEKGKHLVENAELELFPVDLQEAISHNHQLEHPSIKPQGRDGFFSGLKAGKKFNKLVFRALPKACIRQNVKSMLIKAHIIGRGGICYRMEVSRKHQI